MNGNADLNQAGKAKKDEFYTQLDDIEKEITFYRDKFTNKKVLCNCDDPFESNFFRYFVQHFNDLGLSELTVTSYAESKISETNKHAAMFLPEKGFDSKPKPYKAVIRYVAEDVLAEDGSIDYEKLFDEGENELTVLTGNGDFRSRECVDVLESSDIVVTNPPFSLFREYIALLIGMHKSFIIIGNVNAVTYKEVFPLIRDNQVWFGASIHSGDRKFYVPDDYPLEAASCGVDDNGRRYIRVKGIRWFTNMDMAQRHVGIPLKERYDSARFQKYENYDAINVPRTSMIPYDYTGVMGVPVTFLDKYDPEQFEIIMLANGNARTNTDERVLERVGYERHEMDKGGVGILQGKRSYARVFVRNLHPAAGN